MSTKREPLLSDEDLQDMRYITDGFKRPSEKVRDIYEAARAKDAELIHRLVDVVHQMAHFEALYRNGLSQQTVFENWQELASQWHEIGPAAAAAGFKPSDK